MRPAIKRGDVLGVAGDSVLFHGIRVVQYINSRDNESTYGHSAIILDAEGSLLDTRWTVRETNIDRYAGQRMIIARPVGTLEPGGLMRQIHPLKISGVLKNMEKRDAGRWYPVHRLFLHLVPPVAKFLHIKRFQVCSERVAVYLQAIGARPKPVGGATPDMLADEWRRWRNYKVIFEGVWKS